MRRRGARTVDAAKSDQGADGNSEAAADNMDSVKFQFRSGRSGFRNSSRQNSRLKLIISIALALFIGLLCYVLLFPHSDSYVGRKSYGIVIDGGSTGTRIHVFQYEVRNGSPVFDFGEKASASMKVNPGLSAFAEEPERASEAVAKLVEFGQKMVPSEQWGNTPIRLMATAGLRLLDIKSQEKIMEACRRVLRDSRFKFRNDWASVISGSDEGVYAWVVANYALGTLGGDPDKTVGIIELGGASAQVTFVSDETIPPQYSCKVEYGNFTYNLYSHSLLQFGQNVAFDLLRESLITQGQEPGSRSLQKEKPFDPCTPRGYKHDIESWKLSHSTLAEKNRYLSALNPNGNFSQCRSASLMLLQKDKEKCPYKSCSIGSAFIPKLRGKFLATENFFYTSKFFGLKEHAFLSNLMVAGQRFCEEDWSKLKRTYPSFLEEDLLRYCFSSAYIVALLHDSLGIELDDRRIGYANQVEDVPLDWALGAFILQTSTNSDFGQRSWISSIIVIDPSKLIILLAMVLALIFLAGYLSMRLKPQLKKIYDLEKGRYIVITHVDRYS